LDGEISPFYQKYLGKIIFCHKFPDFSEKKNHRKTKIKKPAKEIITIANNMKGHLRFFTFIFPIFSDLAKYTYG
jgi:hypothetical protein